MEEGEREREREREGIARGGSRGLGNLGGSRELGRSRD